MSDNHENRFIDIEISLANYQKIVDELNDIVIKQGRMIDVLIKQNEYLLGALADNNIKPLGEESKPPHY